VATRDYVSKRANIIAALATELKKINGAGQFLVDLNNNVSTRLMFWDEVDDFPCVHLNAGSETRTYQGAGYKDRFLAVTIRCYVNEEDAQMSLNALMEDIETVVENSNTLQYTDKQNQIYNVQQMSIISIDTDEGVLEPYGVGEILIEVRY
tara:strand:+ start:1339 stop:1791 length:453 start_codon:yes stop_codon:yes gene_type:complete